MATEAMQCPGHGLATSAGLAEQKDRRLPGRRSQHQLEHAVECRRAADEPERTWSDRRDRHRPQLETGAKAGRGRGVDADLVMLWSPRGVVDVDDPARLAGRSRPPKRAARGRVLADRLPVVEHFIAVAAMSRSPSNSSTHLGLAAWMRWWSSMISAGTPGSPRGWSAGPPRRAAAGGTCLSMLAFGGRSPAADGRFELSIPPSPDRLFSRMAGPPELPSHGIRESASSLKVVDPNCVPGRPDRPRAVGLVALLPDLADFAIESPLGEPQ